MKSDAKFSVQDGRIIVNKYDGGRNTKRDGATESGGGGNNTTTR